MEDLVAASINSHVIPRSVWPLNPGAMWWLAA
jgi:hypothetical protein